MIKKALCLFVVLLFTFPLYGQREFNPKNILLIYKNGEKKRTFLNSGREVICKLKTGERIKGVLLVFDDYLLVGDQEITLNTIQFIKPNGKLVQSNVNSIGRNSLRSAAMGGDALSPLGLVNMGVNLGLSMALTGKRRLASKGWKFKVVELGKLPFN
ncbi:hypothetical protein [Roseivirga misakiensis]|uniref:Uncharacterized protein n=1 Tax=Roseivirga misakiensis TaxID=1563681 RepID=A0A1E5T7Y9_9BACT|nr:hypothetical protein [Roseivirga misakiensis]OEK07493.1 hypothetical protein BFP71_00365 [Roseivirga misakiensis]